jgi:hypothetical protein
MNKARAAIGLPPVDVWAGLIQDLTRAGDQRHIEAPLLGYPKKGP